MKVILCEDNEKILEQIALYIENYALIEENGIEIQLKATDPFEVISYIQSQRADCYFLDIDLGSEITGLDLAKQIRSLDPLASIIFITSHSEMLRLTFTYHVEALDFIMKDEMLSIKEKVLNALKKAHQKYNKIGIQPELHYFPLRHGEFVKNIEMGSIMFFKVSNIAHKITLHTTQGIYEYYDSLNTVEEFDSHFFRTHRSYVINIKNISKFDKKQKQVIMKDGSICPVAFRRVKSLEQAIHELPTNEP